MSAFTDSPRYSVNTTPAELENLSASSATAATLSDLAIYFLHFVTRCVCSAPKGWPAVEHKKALCARGSKGQIGSLRSSTALLLTCAGRPLLWYGHFGSSLTVQPTSGLRQRTLYRRRKGPAKSAALQSLVDHVL